MWAVRNALLRIMKTQYPTRSSLKEDLASGIVVLRFASTPLGAAEVVDLWGVQETWAQVSSILFSPYTPEFHVLNLCESDVELQESGMMPGEIPLKALAI